MKECLFDLGNGKLVHIAKGAARVDVERALHILESSGPNRCKITKIEKSNINIHVPWFLPNADLRIGLIKRPIKDFKYLAKYATTNDGRERNETTSTLCPRCTHGKKCFNRSTEDVTDIFDEDELVEQDDSSTNVYTAVGVTAALTFAYFIRRRR